MSEQRTIVVIDCVDVTSNGVHRVVAHSPANLQIGLQLGQLWCSTSLVVVVTCTIAHWISRLRLIQELIDVRTLQTETQIAPVVQAHRIIHLNIVGSYINRFCVTGTQTIDLQDST